MYNNFVKPTSSQRDSAVNVLGKSHLSGEEARKIYLNEIKQAKTVISQHRYEETKKNVCHHEKKMKNKQISDKDLFLTVQSDDVDTLKMVLDANPDKVNKLDDYGWSLLMIACQANSIESVKELLKRGIDTSVRDKAGNSAQSLIIKNKNYKLADIILSNKSNHNEIKIKTKTKPDKVDKNDIYFCDLCNIQVSNKEYHLSSTIHNINLSKGKKLPTNYAIPESNKGYQIMLKVGWDKESGLGPDGLGKKYPIKTVQKQDKKGLGHGKRALLLNRETEIVTHKNRKITKRELESNRQMEINFRRQFY